MLDIKCVPLTFVVKNKILIFELCRLLTSGVARIKERAFA